ncbi:MAG: Na+/H+ antiporter NhaA [Acidimicrobiia bacterium]|nr:Na+/H+ antiporter NhaA [Acidimicrobiia bacterium]
MPQRHFRSPRVGRYLPPLGNEFVSVEALSGLVLLGGAVCALVWANLDPSTYTEVWGHELTIGIGDASITLTLSHWINDALMTLFFFVVGLEIKRELVEGELRDRRGAALPVVAALGGMVLPALLFLSLNAGGAGADGWGIPMATDIAFSLGVLALLGSSVSSGVKLFLLTLAIVDDIGAIVVIALFYTSDLQPLWLLGALGAVAIVVLMRRVGMQHPALYLLPGFVLWLCTYESGIHATIAGVVLGLLTPVIPGPTAGPAERLEHRLHPWSSFLVVPLFALANAGVVLGAGAIERAGASTVTWGIAVGLVVGKTIGITAFTLAALRLGLGRLPTGMRARQVVGVAAVAGIGFTVSLFVADLSFTGELLDDAKIGILGASIVAGILGAIMLRATRTGPTIDANVD